MLVVHLVAAAAAASRDPAAASWPADVGFGQHRALIRLNETAMLAASTNSTDIATGTETNGAV